MLRSCRACELERDPEAADRAVRTWLRVQDVRRGAMTIDEAVEQFRAEYEVVPSAGGLDRDHLSD